MNSEILAKINEKTDVIVWFQNQPLSKDLPLFETMNYLVDGLMEDHLNQCGNTTECAFIHHHFGKRLQLFFYGTNTSKINITHLLENEKEYGIIINATNNDFKGRDYFQKLLKWVDEFRF